MFKLQALDHVAISVRDVKRSAQWYIDVLGFKEEHADVWDGVPTFVGNGEAALALFPLPEKATSTSPDRAAARVLHFAFRADRENFLNAQDELRKRGIAFDFSDHEVSHSMYFRDPDGHKIEITTYKLA